MKTLIETYKFQADCKSRLYKNQNTRTNKLGIQEEYFPQDPNQSECK